ncbi:MAG: hypothetical protein WD036_02215 [Bauldia sp.]
MVAWYRRPLAVVALSAAVAGCFQSDDAPSLATEGGGFIFNYRLAEAYAGIVVGPRPNRRLPAGASIEVTFENPAGGSPIIMTRDVTTAKQLRYTFMTPPLSGVRADTGYAVTVRLITADGSEIERIEKIFRSEVDQSVLPDKPLVIGPGYTPNPESAE